MPSLLITVFTLQLVIHLVNTIGAPAISNLVRLHGPNFCNDCLLIIH